MFHAPTAGLGGATSSPPQAQAGPSPRTMPPAGPFDFLAQRLRPGSQEEQEAVKDRERIQDRRDKGETVQPLENVEDQYMLRSLALEMGRFAQMGLTQGLQRPRASTRTLEKLEEDTPEAWERFRRQFETTMVMNEWDNVKGRLMLQAAMEGKAYERTCAIPAEADRVQPPPGAPAGTLPDAAPVAQLLELYERRFININAQATFREELKTARQAETETVQGWHARVDRLYRRAYPELRHVPGGFEAYIPLISTFVEGLKDKAVRDRVRERDPQTMELALTAVNAVEAIVVRMRRSDQVLGAMINQVTPSPRRQYQQQQYQRTPAQTSGFKHRGSARGGAKFRGRGGPLRGTRTPSATSRRKCHFCGHTSHLQRDCKIIERLVKANPEIVSTAPNFRTKAEKAQINQLMMELYPEEQDDRFTGFDSYASKNE